MPSLKRPDGTALWWEEQGEGATLLICNTFNLAMLEPLVASLARERRVISYHPRGVGRSPSTGPYDLETGTADLEALLETAGPAKLGFALGDGAHRAVRLADRRPDLIERVAITSTGIGRSGGAGFSGSSEVLGALMSLMRRDYRSGLRSMLTASAHDEDEERQRVEELAGLIPRAAAVGYLDAWIAADSAHEARRLGPRLAIIAYPGNAWFPLEVFEDMSVAYPDALYEEVEDGPVRRPDQAAELLLRLTS